MKNSLSFLLIIFATILCFILAVIPISWEMRLAEKFLSIEQISNIINNKIQTVMFFMEFSSKNQALKYLIQSGRKLCFYISLCFVLFLILVKLFTLPFNHTFPFKKNLIYIALKMHIFIFCLVSAWGLSYMDYFFHNYYKKSNDNIRKAKSFTTWEGKIYHFILRCQKEIPENDNILLIAKDFSNGFYHFYFNYFLYPRKVYIHFPQASASVTWKRQNWMQKYINSGISLENLDINSLKRKGINWIIVYEESEMFQPDKAEIINLHKLIEQKCKDCSKAKGEN